MTSDQIGLEICMKKKTIFHLYVGTITLLGQVKQYSCEEFTNTSL